MLKKQKQKKHDIKFHNIFNHNSSLPNISRPAGTSVQADQALYCWFEPAQFLCFDIEIPTTWNGMFQVLKLGGSILQIQQIQSQCMTYIFVIRKKVISFDIVYVNSLFFKENIYFKYYVPHLALIEKLKFSCWRLWWTIFLHLCIVLF